MNPAVVIHPIMVHFPVALFCFELLLLVLWKIKNKSEYRFAAGIAFNTAYVMLFAAAVTGFRDAGGTIADLFNGGVRPHFLASAMLFLVTTVRFILARGLKPGTAGHGFTQITGAVLTVAAVIITSFWGGLLVHS